MYYINENLVGLERISYQDNRKDYLRLDLNENPGGLPQDFIQQVLSEITPDFISQYPETKDFTECLTNFLNVERENICLVNGSSEGIRYIIEAYTSPGGKIVGVTPSYAMYEVYAKMYGREFISIEYEEDLTFDVDKIIKSMGQGVQLLILLNPNNPIGNIYTNEQFEQMLKAAKQQEVTVLIDEAYMYFYPNSFIDAAIKQDHVFVTRTFSKLFSLGGCRLGYVVGQKKEIKMIQNLCTPHNTNAFAMRFAQRILETDGMLDTMIAKQLEGKRYLINSLMENNYQIHAEEGNFIFIKPKYLDADTLICKMKDEKGILIKSYDGIGKLGKCLRVTTGEKKFMECFVDALIDLEH